MATLAQLQTDLAQVEEQIRTVIGTGAQHSMSASYAVTQQTLDALEKHAKLLRRRIRTYKGYTSRYSPDFGGTSGADGVPQN